MDKQRGCTPFPKLLVTWYGRLGHPLVKHASPPNSITTAQGTKANACTTDPFGISVTAVHRNANESKTFLVDTMQTSMKNGPYLQQLTKSSVYAPSGWVLNALLTVRELSFRYGSPRETELEKQSLQRMAGRATTFVTLSLGRAVDRLILSEGGVRIGLGKSTQSQGWRLPQEGSSREARWQVYASGRRRAGLCNGEWEKQWEEWTQWRPSSALCALCLALGAVWLEQWGSAQALHGGLGGS